ncbi:hypothetical protein TNCT_545291 [Trichonephila clavata]|uniref:Uncharacterized protein n=1 Tax=Trichonephila clavata TaxID=2740835 RepID=A0A8X6FZF7_TRICU|nr:hypothetical protein TNCT_545291 [Trichonephila clavata]
MKNWNESSHDLVARLVDTAAVNRSEGKDTGSDSGLHLRILPESFLDFDYNEEGTSSPSHRGQQSPVQEGVKGFPLDMEGKVHAPLGMEGTLRSCENRCNLGWMLFMTEIARNCKPRLSLTSPLQKSLA